MKLSAGSIKLGQSAPLMLGLVTLTSTFPANKPSQMSRQKLFKFDEGGTSEIILLFWYLE
jgi:hypothetical protein